MNRDVTTTARASTNHCRLYSIRCPNFGLSSIPYFSFIIPILNSVYAKIIHNHDDRYYTKAETELWRDALINGDLLFNKINSNHIQAGTIVAGSTIIANGAIGDAQISKLSADKLYAGIIDTSNITIAGANGNLRLQGNRLQVFEGIGNKRFERVSLGDVNNDGTLYGLRVRGKDGVTVLYDENGVYNEGITDGAITNDKISENASIDGSKLNIESVINNINEMKLELFMV
jgi:hypothetical protein